MPLPAAAAAPDQVVRAYIAAYDHHDFTTMQTLYPNGPRPDWWDRHQRMGRMWDVQVTPGVSDASYGGSSSDIDVWVDFRYVGSSPQIGYPGPGYRLERQGPDHAWRIVDQGQG